MGKKNRGDRGGGSGNAANVMDTALADLRAAIAAGDILKAEIQTAAIMALPLVAAATPEETEAFAVTLVDSAVREPPTPDDAALFRLLMSLGPRAVKRAASQALGQLTSDGLYPPEWVADIGKPAPGRAWRRYDIFGDEEYVVVTFSYGDAEHALMVAVDLTALPVANLAGVTTDVASVIATLRDHEDPFERFEEISLAQARRRIESPLARAGEDDAFHDLSTSSVMTLPIARSRVRRLPAPSAGDLGTRYTAADRAAAVTEFLRSPQAAEAGDADTARFWAEVLTGYSSRLPGEPPAQAGPRKLGAALLSHVPATFTLSAAQRESLWPAVTAWTRWAAARQQLDEAATEHLMSRLPKVFDDFGSAYDDPYNAEARRYLRDLATSDVDVRWLTDCFSRREFAAPFPGDRNDDAAAFLNAADADHRAVLVATEFATCKPAGMTSKEFVAAAKRVVEELWHGDPPATWETAKRLLAEGNSRHDIIHALARHPG